jgi:hypothetical protein
VNFQSRSIMATNFTQLYTFAGSSDPSARRGFLHDAAAVSFATTLATDSVMGASIDPPHTLQLSTCDPSSMPSTIHGTSFMHESAGIMQPNSLQAPHSQTPLAGQRLYRQDRRAPVNRPPPPPTRNKGVLCTLFLAGSCPFQNCAFAHIRLGERRPVPTAMCTFYLRDRCLREDCSFFHGPWETLVQLHARGAKDYTPSDYLPRGDPTTVLGPASSAEVIASPPFAPLQSFVAEPPSSRQPLMYAAPNHFGGVAPSQVSARALAEQPSYLHPPHAMVSMVAITPPDFSAAESGTYQYSTSATPPMTYSVMEAGMVSLASPQHSVIGAGQYVAQPNPPLQGQFHHHIQSPPNSSWWGQAGQHYQ